MTVMAEVASYLVTTSTRFSAGASSTAIPLWMSQHPEGQPDTSVALFESGGPGPLYTQNGLTIERPTIQIISRSSSYATARDNAQHIHDILAAVTNQTLGTTPYVTITPVQSPFSMGFDALERPLISCNFVVEKEPS